MRSSCSRVVARHALLSVLTGLAWGCTDDGTAADYPPDASDGGARDAAAARDVGAGDVGVFPRDSSTDASGSAGGEAGVADASVADGAGSASSAPSGNLHDAAAADAAATDAAADAAAAVDAAAAPDANTQAVDAASDTGAVNPVMLDSGVTEAGQTESPDADASGPSCGVDPLPACPKADGETCSLAEECLTGSCITYYLDLNHDGFGERDATQGFCAAPPLDSGFVANAPRCMQAAYPSGEYNIGNPNPTIVLSVSSSGSQDIFAGISSDGNTILVQHFQGADAWLFDGDYSTLGYAGNDVGGQLTSFQLAEARLSLAPDGLGVIGVLAADFGFGIQRRASRSATEFSSVETTEFQNINSWATTHSAQVSSPILSADGLSLFFFADLADTVNDGEYEVTRTQVGDAFGAPSSTPFGGDITGYTVTGVSSDRLTVFASYSWATDIFLRQDLNSAFIKRTTTPIDGFRMMPVDADCHQIIGTGTPGGAQSEEVYIRSDN